MQTDQGGFKPPESRVVKPRWFARQRLLHWAAGPFITKMFFWITQKNTRTWKAFWIPKKLLLLGAVTQTMAESSAVLPARLEANSDSTWGGWHFESVTVKQVCPKNSSEGEDATWRKEAMVCQWKLWGTSMFWTCHDDRFHQHILWMRWTDAAIRAVGKTGEMTIRKLQRFGSMILFMTEDSFFPRFKRNRKSAVTERSPNRCFSVLQKLARLGFRIAFGAPGVTERCWVLSFQRWELPWRMVLWKKTNWKLAVTFHIFLLEASRLHYCEVAKWQLSQRP